MPHSFLGPQMGTEVGGRAVSAVFRPAGAVGTYAEGTRLVTDPLTTLMAGASAGMRVFPSGLLAQGEGEDLTLIEQIFQNPLVLPIGLFLIFYLTFIAPERRRKAEEAKKMAALKKNDRVVTVGGIHGTIVSVASDSDLVTVRIDENNNTRIKVNRSAIASIVGPSQENRKEARDKTPESDAKESS